MKTHCGTSTCAGHVAVVDDDPTCLQLVEFILTSAGISVVAFPTAEDLFESLDLASCRCILLDQNLPGMSGLDFECLLEANGVRIPILFITSEADIPTATALLNHGAVDVIPKPLDPADLIEKVSKFVDHPSTQAA